MSADDLPLVGGLFDAGPDDRTFDALLLAGPLLIVVVAVADRSFLTSLLAVGYLVAFVSHTVSNGLSSQ
ncbi:hypothetical protein [Halorussus sp. MSC15.2]|uniref:hypothetical protein n=1 Tax=Halorussus sp. MSC15.2 TaxID=2283638 RepID=UPI0013D74BC4|nr:hypothetical protein [Halorussus sp. MSC15.2]NEU57855.1 hypothetical protein [Halorussus sp. MSC15.2]